MVEKHKKNFHWLMVNCTVKKQFTQFTKLGPTVAIDSSSWLTRMYLDMIFSSFDVVFFLRCFFFVHRSNKESLFKLLIQSAHSFLISLVNKSFSQLLMDVAAAPL